jgi:hypothetical protein
VTLTDGEAPAGGKDREATLTSTWEKGRERAPSEVRDVFAPTERQCPSCGAVAVTSSRTCPSCGKPYVSRRSKPIGTRRARRITAVVAVAVLAVLGGAVALLAPGVNSAKRADAAATRLRDARIRQAVIQRTTADQRLHLALAGLRDPGPGAPLSARLRDRAALVGKLQLAIAADARARVRAGTLTGPVLYVKCSPYPPDSAAADAVPSVRLGPYACLAVNHPIKSNAGVVGLLGDPFWARIDFTAGRLAWCKINPRPGEQAIGAGTATVPLAAACDLTRSVARLG